MTAPVNGETIVFYWSLRPDIFVGLYMGHFARGDRRKTGMKKSVYAGNVRFSDQYYLRLNNMIEV